MGRSTAIASRRALASRAWTARVPALRALWPCVVTCTLVLVAAADASAYCRTRTCQLSSTAACTRDAATGCYSEGVAVYWASDCISYAIQRDGSLAQGISAEQTASLVDAGFRA